MEAFISSLIMVALAELGDKTQLVTLALAGRYRTVTVAAGVCLGTLLTNLLATAGGTLIGAALPVTPIKLAAGLIFIGFAVWSLLDRCEGDSCDVNERQNPLFAIAAAFFAAELGDKTQLTALTLAAESGAFVPVWVGASLGMMLAVAVAIALGSIAHSALPERTIRCLSSVVFAVFGIITVLDALSGLI